MNGEPNMCTALKVKNFIVISDADNPIQEATDEFQKEVAAQSISGLISSESQSVFYLYKDGSCLGIFQHGITISDPDMVLAAFMGVAIKKYEEDHGGPDRVRHDG